MKRILLLACVSLFLICGCIIRDPVVRPHPVKPGPSVVVPVPPPPPLP